MYVYGNIAFPIKETAKPDIGFGYLRNYSQKKRLNLSGNIAQSPVFFTLQFKAARDYKLLGYGKLRLYGSPYALLKNQSSRAVAGVNTFSFQVGIQPSLEYSPRSKIQFITSLPISVFGVSDTPSPSSSSKFTAGTTLNQTQFIIGCRLNVLNSDKVK
jgi:hypothetical protein